MLKKSVEMELLYSINCVLDKCCQSYATATFEQLEKTQSTTHNVT